MINIHKSCLEYGKQKNYVDYNKGANISAFIKVADAMLAQGVVWLIMVYSTEAIVLGYINYSETSVIVKCLTKKYGVKSYIIRGIRSNKKSKIQLGHLQRLNIVDLESKENKKGDLSYLKNIKSLISFQSINSDILKYNTALFISEVLISVINHYEDYTFEILIPHVGITTLGPRLKRRIGWTQIQTLDLGVGEFSSTLKRHQNHLDL